MLPKQLTLGETQGALFFGSILQTTFIAEFLEGDRLKLKTVFREESRLLQFDPLRRDGVAWQTEHFYLEVPLEDCEYFERAPEPPSAD